MQCRGTVRSLRWKLGAAFASSVLVLVLGAVGLWTFEQERVVLDEIERARGLFTSTRTVRQALLDAETGQRGFLLTEASSYLEPYRDAMNTIETALLDFDLAAREFDISESAIADLHRAVESKRDELSRTVAMGEEGDFESARGYVDTDIGREQMERIREMLRDFEGRALASMQHRRVEHASRRRVAQIVLVAGTAIAFTLLMLVYLGIRSDVDEQARIRKALEETNAALDKEQARLQAQAEDLERQLARIAELTRAMGAQNAELQIRNRDLDHFAYVASHDLRAPLRGISNLAQWIEEDMGGEKGLPETTREHLRLLKGRVTRMDGLIDGVLTYSRAGRGRGEPCHVQVIVAARHVVDSLEAGETVRLSTTLDGLAVWADPVQLAQVLQNLVSNALRHADAAHPEVEVFGRTTGDLVEISVRDNGQGIEERYHERIFGMFQTLAARDDVESTGIGLAVVKKIVEANGGEVGVVSSPGAGATFSFTWQRQETDSSDGPH